MIEDDPATRHAMVEALREHDFDVMCAQDGFLALRLASIGHPDLIVLDLGLPCLDGKAFLARLRKCTWIPSVPVVVVSSRPDAELLIGPAAAAAFLTKPFELTTLIGVARSLLLRTPPQHRIA